MTSFRSRLDPKSFGFQAGDKKCISSKSTDLTGFTVVEVVIVVFILGLVMIVLLDSYTKFLARKQLDEAVENSVSLLGKARNLTLSSQDSTGTGKIYGVHIDDKNASPANRVVFFIPSGANYAYNPADSNNVIYQLPTNVEISWVATDPAVSNKEFYFKRITGEAQLWDSSQTKLVFLNSGLFAILSLKTNVTKIISINQTGVIQQVL